MVRNLVYNLVQGDFVNKAHVGLTTTSFILWVDFVLPETRITFAHMNRTLNERRMRRNKTCSRR